MKEMYTKLIYFILFIIIINNQSIMKVLFIISLLVLAINAQTSIQNCYNAATKFQAKFVDALKKADTEIIIDQIEILFQDVPALLETCGAETQAQQVRNDYPPACTKLLSKEAKLLLKILRLYAEDQKKNQKAIIVYSTMFETIYKTQVQKKCPTLSEHQLGTVQNKGDCAQGAYRLSLVFEKVDNDLMKGDFNASLTDMGKVIKQLPLALDSCNQHGLAKFFRNTFPDQCLGAIGGLVREIAILEHNYSHLEWLKKHFKDFTKAIVRVRDACPTLEHK